MGVYKSKFTGFEIDLLLEKAKSGVYSKGDVDGLVSENYEALMNYIVTTYSEMDNNKANKDEVYSRNETDTKVGTLTNAIAELDKNKANKADVYSKEETIQKITEKIAEIVANAPEEFDTLKEMSDWLTEHESSAAAMNTAIQKNTEDISALEEAKAEKSLVYTKEETDEDILSKINYSLGCSRKNLINYGVTDNSTTNGITITVNDDKSITVNGTQDGTTNDTAFCIQHETPIPRGEYIISGCPTGGGFDTYQIQLYFIPYEGASHISYYDNGEGCKLVVTSDTAKLRLYILVRKNVSMDNLTFYPMIRYAVVNDDTYEPPKTSIEEISEEFNVLSKIMHPENKNLLRNTAISQTVNGVTFTVNPDRSITCNGTASENAFFVLGGTTPLSGRTILSGAPVGGGAKIWSLQIYEMVEGVVTIRANDYGEGNTRTYTEGDYFGKIVIREGQTVENLTFYPMLRYEDTEETYEPYVPDLKEKLDLSLAMINELEARIIALETTSKAE